MQRIPNTTLSLSATEWVRGAAPGSFGRLRAALFDAHFAAGEDLEDTEVLERHAARSGVDVGALRTALDRRAALAALERSEALSRRAGVSGTPAWQVGGVLVNGLRPAPELAQLADRAQ